MFGLSYRAPWTKSVDAAARKFYQPLLSLPNTRMPGVEAATPIVSERKSCVFNMTLLGCEISTPRLINGSFLASICASRPRGSWR